MAADSLAHPTCVGDLPLVRIALAIILVEDAPTCVRDISQDADALAIILVGHQALFVAPRVLRYQQRKDARRCVAPGSVVHLAVSSED